MLNASGLGNFRSSRLAAATIDRTTPPAGTFTPWNSTSRAVVRPM
jgi:hypothetical protein